MHSTLVDVPRPTMINKGQFGVYMLCMYLDLFFFSFDFAALFFFLFLNKFFLQKNNEPN